MSRGSFSLAKFFLSFSSSFLSPYVPESPQPLTLNSLCQRFSRTSRSDEYPLRSIGTAEMTSYLSRLSPVPGFPEYTGPHKVGTIDVELPVSELDCPSPSPDENISTVQYRIFYPCQPDAKGKKNVNWLPAPQRGYISAYTKFLGAGSMLADLIS